MAEYGSSLLAPTEDHRGLGKYRPPAQGRRIILPLLLSLGIFSVASLAAKFLAPRGIKGRPDGGTRFATAATAGEKDEDVAAFNSSDDCTAATTYALLGVDLVSYASLAAGDEPAIGSTRYSSSYGGYSYLFSSARNKALFEAEPDLYLPAWGGFCGYGIAQESTWSATYLGPPIDIAQWSISPDGKLRFFRSQNAKEMFLDDMEANVAAGDARWISWFGYDSTTYPFDVSCFYHETAGDH